ncbi:MAG TPA: ExeM/NucH family extracellular endonuclease, partial [Anaerolinea sp.]|nr:ExeM/NucH family extracellular endonuclease [Anaerolinea sp.]
VLRCSTGNSVAATPLALPVTSPDAFEPYEGMLVTFPQPLVISEYFNFDRFGEIVLTSRRHLTPTAEYEPGSPEALQAMQDFLLDKITLDDGRSVQNPNPAIHPDGAVFDLTNLFRGGDTVTNVTGVMDYSFGLYRIQPTQGAEYTSLNSRPAQPPEVGGNLKVASFNVLNYFTTIDTGAFICGPAADQECRGADTPEELARQRAKILAALSAVQPDIAGLMEIQNDDDASVADLVSGLNDVFGAGTYDYVRTGFIGTDAIKLALIYKPASVSLVGGYAILDSTVDPRFIDTKNRPTLAQTFMDNTTGGIFTVAVNHLKSKGSDCNDMNDPDLLDGAGNCNLTRTAAAQALVDWLASDPTGSGDSDYLIIGDLNSYDKEDPIDAIKAGPDDILGTADDYTDLIFNYQGEDAYSYVFDGQIGYLDYALASPGLVSEVTGTADWHINADEPDLIDYDMSFKAPAQDALYAPDPYRASDHDPVIVGLNVCDEIAPTLAVSVTPDVLWPANH